MSKLGLETFLFLLCLNILQRFCEPNIAAQVRRNLKAKR